MADALKGFGAPVPWLSTPSKAQKRMSLLEREQLDLAIALSMSEQEQKATHAPAPVARTKSAEGDASLKTLRERQEDAMKDVQSPWFVGTISKDDVDVTPPPPPQLSSSHPVNPSSLPPFISPLHHRDVFGRLCVPHAKTMQIVIAPQSCLTERALKLVLRHAYAHASPTHRWLHPMQNLVMSASQGEFLIRKSSQGNGFVVCVHDGGECAKIYIERIPAPSAPTLAAFRVGGKVSGQLACL